MLCSNSRAFLSHPRDGIASKPRDRRRRRINSIISPPVAVSLARRAHFKQRMCIEPATSTHRALRCFSVNVRRIPRFPADQIAISPRSSEAALENVLRPAREDEDGVVEGGCRGGTGESCVAPCREARGRR